MRSPENTASPPEVVSRTQTWPGVCPGVGSNRRWRPMAKVLSTSIARPASTMGVTLSAMQPSFSAPVSLWCFQNCHSSPTKTYRAFGNVGTQRPSTSEVFQPTWSMCRWVHTT